MNSDQTVQTLKKLLKSKKLTYQELGEEIGMSESGVKKLFSGKDFSLKRLNQIANVLGISMAAIFQLAQEEEIKHVSLTPKQENALYENQNLFRVFWWLAIESKKPDEIKRLEKLTSEQIQRLFMKLENLDLIKISAQGRVASSHRGLVRWVSEGPLLKKINREWSELTLSKAIDNPKQSLHRLSYLKLSEKSKINLANRLNDVIGEFARLSQRERLEFQDDELKPVSLLLALSFTRFL